MKITIVDVETTGTDLAKDELCEVGFVEYSTEHRTILNVGSRLFPTTNGNAAADINGIPPAVLLDAAPATKWIGALMSSAEVFASHTFFDRDWLPKVDKPWFDTCSDFDWPHAGVSRTLSQLALAHGVGLVSAHRAIFDCLTIAMMFQRIQAEGCDLPALVELALRPRVLVRAMTEYHQNDIMKRAGFFWDPAIKAWCKRALEGEEFPFKVKKILTEGTA